ncbi:wall-associated receptor kinase 2 [Olea europaea subsp. europaea]|uniref:Wall-associated receptor kinase 2 n=1 Tax=Olea europaea subsp. europaea TaxID=158383 RepID=A0A8S0RRF8_OLEEU|nr:wall-associated receptor kinase 2 [Olea europaea subsp. europaea]
MQQKACILLILWLPFSFSISKQTINNSTIALPGCPTKCGNVSVPYPFGIGLDAGCSIGPWYDINCSKSFNPPKPFLSRTNGEIIDISETKIRVKSSGIAYRCYNQTGGITRKFPTLYGIDETSPFSFSNENKFIVVGCDDVSFMTKVATGNLISSCAAICSQSSDLSDGSCSGIGCCQNSLPKGVKNYITSLRSYGNHTNVSSFNLCGYSFLGEHGRYRFHPSDVSDSNFEHRIVETVPMILDWVIGNQTCAEAQKSSLFACQENSICVDSDTGLGGYHCNCSKGYKGNPYLRPGCQDINECENNPCHPYGICTNTLGGYKCSCQHGYFGDGSKFGSGCIGQRSNKASVLTVTYWLYKVVKKRRKCNRKQKYFKRNGGLLLQQQISTKEGHVEKTRLFTAKELSKATDQFNESRILDKGGQGTVYKGMLSDGRTVAVKKSKLVGENRLDEFINEVLILSQINHRNVVVLLGCCLETEVPLLVYEFIANRSLFDHIHDPSAEFPMTWDMRLKIAVEVAGALAYLHYSTSTPIYHRDIKSSNILLDENYRPKVSDFGISRSIAVDKTHFTTLVKGTFGYLDPEYFRSSQFTDKSDVYSFGVVLIELLSGQKPIVSSDTEDERSLAACFLMFMEQNCLHKFFDPIILEHDKDEDIIAVATLAYRCLNLNGKKRPTMKEVSMELENIKLSKGQAIVQSNTQVISTEVGSVSLLYLNSTWTSGDRESTVPSETNPLLHYTV